MQGDDLFSRFLELSESGGQVDKNPELALCIYYSFVSWDSLFQVRLDSRGDIIRRRIDKTRFGIYLKCSERLSKEIVYRLGIEQEGLLKEFLLEIQNRLNANDVELQSYAKQVGRRENPSQGRRKREIR